MPVNFIRAAALTLLFVGAPARAAVNGNGGEQTPPEAVEPVAEINYRPEVFGAVKAKFETSLYDGAHRFNVRNSRVGVRGFASPRFKYAVQIDFSNEGKLSVLDSYITYFTDRLEVSLGQQQYRFSTDLDRGPNTTIFSNRSFLAKFLTTYYTTTTDGTHVGHTVSSIGARDLGALVRYRLRQAPLRFSLGAFNGSGTNNPEWDNEINLIARVEIGREEGLHGALAHYNGHTPVTHKATPLAGGGYETTRYTQRMRMWGGELFYTGNNWTIESEYAQRHLRRRVAPAPRRTRAGVVRILPAPFGGFHLYRPAGSLGHRRGY